MLFFFLREEDLIGGAWGGKLRRRCCFSPLCHCSSGGRRLSIQNRPDVCRLLHRCVCVCSELCPRRPRRSVNGTKNKAAASKRRCCRSKHWRCVQGYLYTRPLLGLSTLLVLSRKLGRQAVKKTHTQKTKRKKRESRAQMWRRLTNA